MEEDGLEARAYHEAGHAAVAWSLGIFVHELTIEEGRYQQGWVGRQNALAGVAENAFDGREAGRLQAEREIVSLFAGALAEARYTNGGFDLEAAGCDLTEAQDRLRLLEPEPEVRDALQRYLEVKTTAVLERRWSLVKALASDLLAYGTLSGMAVLSVVRRHASAPRMDPSEA